MFSKARKKNVLYAVIALMFTFVLFFNANGSTLQKKIIPSSTSYEETIKNIPIQSVYDSDHYFIQGFNTTVALKLTSDNRVQLNTEKNIETRNFRVVADLSKLSVGTHEVPLKIQNLSSGVTAVLSKKTITVTIEKKVTKKMKISPVISQENLQDGYQLGKITVEPAEVEITTGEDTLKELVSIEAPLTHLTHVSKDIATKVTLTAVDAQGEKLPVVISPEQALVEVTVNAPMKKVPVVVTPTGTMDRSVASLAYRINYESVTLTGNQTTLDTISQIALPIDIHAITKQTKVEVSIPVPSGLASNPEKVTVTIIPTLKQTSASSTSSTTSNSASTSSSAENTAEKSSAMTSSSVSSSTKEATNP